MGGGNIQIVTVSGRPITNEEAQQNLLKVVAYIQATFPNRSEVVKTIWTLVEYIKAHADEQSDQAQRESKKDPTVDDGEFKSNIPELGDPEQEVMILVADHDTIDYGVNNKMLRTLPECLYLRRSKVVDTEVGVFAGVQLPNNTCFGPYQGDIVDHLAEQRTTSCWQLSSTGDRKLYIDGHNPSKANWMAIVRCDHVEDKPNLMAFQHAGGIYYKTTTDIKPGSELVVDTGIKDEEDLQDVSEDTAENLQLATDEDLNHLPYEDDAPPSSDDDKPVLDDDWDNDQPKIQTRAQRRHKPPSSDDDKPVVGEDRANGKRKKQTRAQLRHKKVINERQKLKQWNAKFDVKNKQYSCLTCSKKIKRFSRVEEHHRLHTGERPYVCRQCGKGFMADRYLDIHALTHASVKPHVCNVCGKAFSLVGNLTRHKLIHTGERPYKCQVCDLSFSDKSTLRRHTMCHSSEKRTYTDEGSYPCVTCGKCFRRPHYLKAHESIHSSIKPHSCPMCLRAFRSRTNLSCHLKTHQSKINRPKKPLTHVCYTCGKAFNTNSILKKHEQLHSDERPFTCAECGKNFKSKKNLAEHKRTHTNTNLHYCTVCDQAFRQSGNLNRHMRVHTGEKPHQCQVCGRRFADQGTMKRHEVLHANGKILEERPRPFVCILCNKGFTHQKYLDQHSITHSTEKSHGCGLCGQKFRYKYNLNCHMKIHTGGKSPPKHENLSDQYMDDSFTTVLYITEDGTEVLPICE